MHFLQRAAMLAVIGVAGYLAPETTFGQTVEALPPQRDTGPSPSTDIPAGQSDAHVRPIVPPPTRPLPQTDSAPAMPSSGCDHRAPGNWRLIRMLRIAVDYHIMSSRNGDPKPCPLFQSHAALAVLFRKQGSILVRTAHIIGLQDIVRREADGELPTTALDVRGHP